ncbi:MAG: PadR family transcriptional regulator [Mycobacterium sp.]|nr:PadR family transcriptional regulator [Mycobacterium sp.]
MTLRPTASSFAVLGLLALQPWSAYELVRQSKRSLHWFWPRSERHLYAELKRLVERGHAETHVEGGRRQRTCYTITPAGRAALQEWLHTEPAPPTLEIEGLLRVMLGDQGSMEDLRAALETTLRQVRNVRADGIPLVADLLATGGPFPQRLHLNERLVSFHADFNNLLIRWCEETLAEIETWHGTQDIGLTPRGRERLVRAIADEP